MSEVSIGVAGEATGGYEAVSERLDPVFRELLSTGLVVRRQGGGERAWELVEPAQRRLDELDRVAADPSKVQLYFGHRCAVCHEDRVTRMRSGRHVCEECDPG